MKHLIAAFWAFAPLGLMAADNATSPAGTVPVKQTKANYELATRWTPAKVDKLLFDTAVTPHWLDTGDLGYIADGEIYLTSRTKDLIKRVGRSIHPHDVEAAIGEIPGVRKGCVAVFGYS